MYGFRWLSPRLDSFFQKDYAPQRLLDASEQTAKVYKITLKFFDEFLRRPARLCDLNDATVGSFAQARMNVVKRATVKRDLDVIFAIWRFAHLTGKVRKGPTLKQLHVATPSPIALSEAQIHAVWDAIQCEAKHVAISSTPTIEVPGPIWWSALFLTCWDTGERLSPVLELVEANLDTVEGYVKFIAEDRKGKTSDSLKRLHPDTLLAISRLLDCYPVRRNDSKVFRWSANRGAIWSRLGAIMVRAGLPDSREFKFHAVRKSSVSHFAAAGGDPVAHAGHSSDVITRRHYLDQRVMGSDRNAAHLLFRPGGQLPPIEEVG